MKLTGKFAWSFYLFFCAALVVLAFRWIPNGVRVAIPTAAYQLDTNSIALFVHMIGSAVPMALIPFQLMNRLRARRLRLHRAMGRISVAGVLIGGIALIPLAINMQIPLFGRVGYVFAGFAWMIPAVIAVIAIRRGNVQRHRWWMMICATVIFSAVTFRFVLPSYRYFGFADDYANALTVWTSLALNLAAFFTWQYRAKLLGAVRRRSHFGSPG